MKITKKIMALILTVLMAFSTVAVSASALDSENMSVPVLKAILVSETNTQAVIEFSLVSGNFSALDVTFKPQGNFNKLTKIEKTDNLKKIILATDTFLQTTNVSTGKISIATNTPVEGKVSLYRFTFSKKTSANTNISDLDITVTNCEATLKASNVENVTSKVTASFALYTMELDNYSLTMNYKQTQKLNVTTNYDTSKLVWTSSNEKVATVDNDGNVKTVGTGSAVIKVATPDGSAFAECTVNSSYSTIQWIIVILLFGWIWY